jgi:hypothetical protein
MSTSTPPPALPPRTALLLLMALLAGILLGALTYLDGGTAWRAMAVGVVSAGAAFLGFDKAIGS